MISIISLIQQILFSLANRNRPIQINFGIPKGLNWPQSLVFMLINDNTLIGVYTLLELPTDVLPILPD